MVTRTKTGFFYHPRQTFMTVTEDRRGHIPTEISQEMKGGQVGRAPKAQTSDQLGPWSDSRLALLSSWLWSFFLLPCVHLSAPPTKSCSSAGIANLSLGLAPLASNCCFLEFLLPTGCSTLCRESDPPQDGV